VNIDNIGNVQVENEGIPAKLWRVVVRREKANLWRTWRHVG
jgi:hypothetical protein